MRLILLGLNLLEESDHFYQNYNNLFLFLMVFSETYAEAVCIDGLNLWVVGLLVSDNLFRSYV